jgi:hypothetical protein
MAEKTNNGNCLRYEGDYPRRSPERLTFDVDCSISQNIQTNALPRLATTPMKTKVIAGAVSMFNIPDAMQATYQRTQAMTASMMPPHRGRAVHPGITGSAAHLHRPDTPAIRRQHAPPHDVAAAVTVIGTVVVVGVIGIAVIIIAVVVAVAQAEA